MRRTSMTATELETMIDRVYAVVKKRRGIWNAIEIARRYPECENIVALGEECLVAVENAPTLEATEQELKDTVAKLSPLTAEAVRRAKEAYKAETEANRD